MVAESATATVLPSLAAHGEWRSVAALQSVAGQGGLELWDIADPTLYALKATLCTGVAVESPDRNATNTTAQEPRTSRSAHITGAGCYTTLDVLNSSVGFRSIRWNTSGMHLNERRVQLRGLRLGCCSAPYVQNEFSF